jgi:hypothetical protein
MTTITIGVNIGAHDNIMPSQTLTLIEAWVTQSLLCWVQHDLDILMLKHYKLHFLFPMLEDLK